MQKVSCIICAHNESARIPSVLEALKNHPLIDETIVIDDGSTDATAETVRSYPWVRLISYRHKMGKSAALAIGIGAAKDDFVAVLDADLIGLTAENVTELIKPILSGNADISISLRKNSLGVYKLLGLDFVSGERVFRKSFIAPHLDTLAKLPGFSLEVFMNQLIIKNNLRVKIVHWKNVVNPRKSSKVGLLKGMFADFLMLADILKVISPRDIVVQNYRILSLATEDDSTRKILSAWKIPVARLRVRFEEKVASKKH